MNGFKTYFKRITLLLAVLGGSAFSCTDNFESSIPYVKVNYQGLTSNMNNLTVVGGAEYISGEGYGGIWVVRGFDDVYYAFDAACPYEVDPTVIIECDGGIGTCPKCETHYYMMEGGYVLSGIGPGTEPLLQYQSYVSGGRLFITN